MGITTYLFHRSESLGKQQFNMFFLDMGENIHFHYRDLRIELSVNEFVELAGLFNDYAKEVLTEIDGGYRDGVLANTNETGTLKTFWDKERPLTHPVKYHEKRLAIEETKDGYHLHLRNYKILLKQESFQALAQAMAEVGHLLGRQTLVRDPVALLEQNELQIRLLSRYQSDSIEELRISIHQTHVKKASQVLQAIGYLPSGRKDGAALFTRNDSTVFLVSSAEAAPGVTLQDNGFVVNFPRFLSVHGAILDADQLNVLKLRIIFLLKQAESGRLAPFRLQDLYINPDTFTPAVDIFASPENADPTEEIQALTKLLVSHKLFFVKPEKEILAHETAASVQDTFFRFINENIACHEFVRKIIVLGSSTNHRIGRYRVPFVHFDWVKLNSDFDIYVEMDPDYQGELPENWQKQFYWQRAGSDYYHFGDLGNGMASSYAERYPGVRFYEHLVEGYLFDYHHGDKERRDAWLKEIRGHCIFKRDRVAAWIAQHYSLQVFETEPFNAASFNKVYLVRTDGCNYVLKSYGAKYQSAKDRERISYEIELLDALRESELTIALPIKNKSGKYIAPKDNDQTVLFTFVPGVNLSNPEPRQIRAAGQLLARFHLAAQDYRTKRARKFSNKDPLHYWLEAWQHYRADNVVGTDVDLDIAACRHRLAKLKSRPGHCHGDLSVINFLFEEDRCWLIDFQSVCYGPMVIDLANAMIEFSAGKGVFVDANLRHLREGYEEVRPLEAKERGCLNDLLIIQAIVRQAKLMRLHFGGFGYDLRKERLLGLEIGIKQLLESAPDEQ